MVDFWPRRRPLHDPPRRRKKQQLARSSRPGDSKHPGGSPGCNRVRRAGGRASQKDRRRGQGQGIVGPGSRRTTAQRRQEQEKAHRPSPPHSPPQSPAATLSPFVSIALSGHHQRSEPGRRHLTDDQRRRDGPCLRGVWRQPQQLSAGFVADAGHAVHARHPESGRKERPD